MQLSPGTGVLPNWGASTLMDFDINNVQEGQRIRGSNRQYVRFYNKKFVEVFTSEARINPVTGSSQPLKLGTREVEREMVYIQTPGDKNIVDDFAEDFHRREHWKHYKAFRDGNAAPIGTPIDEVSFISQNIATELKYLGCHTLEQFADSSDILVGRVGNGWELREFARAMVKAETENKSLGTVNALKAELSAAKNIADNQARQIQELQGQMQSFILNAQGKVYERESEPVVETPKKKGMPKGGWPKKLEVKTDENSEEKKA